MQLLFVVCSPLAVSKHIPWCRQPPFAGVVTDFSRVVAEGVIRLRCKPTTVAKVRGMIDRFVSEGSLSPSQASSSRGKLLWVWLYQKLGKAEWSAIVERQHAPSSAGRAEGERWPIPAELHDALGFVRGMLDGELPDVMMRASMSRRSLLLCCLMPCGGRAASGTLAFVVWVPLTPRGEGKFAFAEMAAPSDLLSALMSMRAQKTFIIPLEQLALQGAYVCEELSANLRDRLVIHCADNKAANAGAIKGFSGSRDLAAIVRATRGVS